MKQFYLDDEGKPAGPYPIDQIREFLRDRVVTPDRLASESPEGPWTSLQQLGITVAQPIAVSSNLPPPQAVSTGFDPIIWVQSQSPLAIASVVCGVLTILPLVGWITCIGALVCGHIALVQLKKTPGMGGRGLAIAGLVLGYLGVGFCVLKVISLIYAASHPSAAPYYMAGTSAASGLGCCGAIAGFYALIIAMMLGGIALVIYLAIWVSKDAKARGVDNPTLWVLLIIFTNLLGLIIYLCIRPPGRLVPCPSCQNHRLETLTRCPHCGNP